LSRIVSFWDKGLRPRHAGFAFSSIGEYTNPDDDFFFNEIRDCLFINERSIVLGILRPEAIDWREDA
jgi:hypothetical protein